MIVSFKCGREGLLDRRAGMFHPAINLGILIVRSNLATSVNPGFDHLLIVVLEMSEIILLVAIRVQNSFQRQPGALTGEDPPANPGSFQTLGRQDPEDQRIP